MPLLDLRKQHSALYKPGSKMPSVIDVPSLRFLMVDGMGPIGESAEGFQEALGALFALSWATKFAAKKALDLAYPVMPLEGLYWDAEEGPLADVPLEAPERLAWRLMILLPSEVPGELVEDTAARVAAKKDPPRLGDVRVQTFTEGPSVQMMHLGPYSAETPTLASLRRFAQERGLEFSGAHHEIYLGDPRRAAPEKLKTVLRYPVRKRR